MSSSDSSLANESTHGVDPTVLTRIYEIFFFLGCRCMQCGIISSKCFHGNLFNIWAVCCSWNNFSHNTCQNTAKFVWFRRKKKKHQRAEQLLSVELSRTRPIHWKETKFPWLRSVSRQPSESLHIHYMRGSFSRTHLKRAYSRQSTYSTAEKPYRNYTITCSSLVKMTNKMSLEMPMILFLKCETA